VLFVVPPSCAVAVVDRVLGAVSEAAGPMSAYVLRHMLGQFADAEKASAGAAKRA
jgi:hypothetical protein